MYALSVGNFQLLKRERIRKHVYATRKEARSDVFSYIEMFYNPKVGHFCVFTLEADLFEHRCIDPAVSAQVRLLKHKPQRGSSCPAPDEGAGGYKSRSNLRSHDWRAAVSRSGGGVRIGL